MTDKQKDTLPAAPPQLPIDKVPPAPGEEVRRGPKQPQLLRGMKDILPVDQMLWQVILRRVDDEAAAYGFERIEVPIVEATSLFNRSIGTETDIVEKEMYTFADKGGDSIALRPELTAGIARAYIEHGMLNLPQPVKLYGDGPIFRYERPQAGRYRQSSQIDFEVIGDAHAVADAELIILLNHFFRSFGLTPSPQVNSIGDQNCRPAYKKALVDYCKTRKNQLCEDCQRRLLKNPLRLLDCKVPDCQAITADAPQIVDHLCEDCKNHFVRVLEYLDEAEVPYVLNPRLVRGLDYYSRTTFEVWSADSAEGGALALGGGGRYDGLIEALGGRPTPAVGFAVGLERLVHLLKERQYVPERVGKGELFLAQLGEPARKRALKLFNDLRAAGFRVTAAFSKEGIKPQLEIANRLNVKFSLIIGQKEMMDDTILVRDMENGIQEIIDYKKVVVEMQKRLSKTINGVARFTHQPGAEGETHPHRRRKSGDEPERLIENIDEMPEDSGLNEKSQSDNPGTE